MKNEAEKLRALVQSTESSNGKLRNEEHTQYVKKMIEKKFTPFASKGKTEYKMKVPKKMSRKLLNQELIDKGFKTRYLSVCGKQFIVVQW